MAIVDDKPAELCPKRESHWQSMPIICNPDIRMTNLLTRLNQCRNWLAAL
jgi:hypothetical protein